MHPKHPAKPYSCKLPKGGDESFQMRYYMPFLGPQSTPTLLHISAIVRNQNFIAVFAVYNKNVVLWLYTHSEL